MIMNNHDKMFWHR